MLNVSGKFSSFTRNAAVYARPSIGEFYPLWNFTRQSSLECFTLKPQPRPNTSGNREAFTVRFSSCDMKIRSDVYYAVCTSSSSQFKGKKAPLSVHFNQLTERI